MSGTDRKRKLLTGGPKIVLVEPQLGENIGMVARAMANFGLSELRLVNPRDGWPNEKARASASRADHVIDGTKVYGTLAEALSDCNWVMATTARKRDMIKPVLMPDEAARLIHARDEAGGATALLFGRERWGLENDEVAMADEIITFPVNPAFASLNIAQAVLLMSYELLKQSSQVDLTGFSAPAEIPAQKESIDSLYARMEAALEESNFFFPPEKADRLRLNLRSLLSNARLQEPEIHLLHGVIASLERRWKQKSEE